MWQGITLDPEREISRLFREGVVEGVEIGEKVYRVHRVGVGDYRLFYVMMPEEELIVFLDVRHRRVAYG